MLLTLSVYVFGYGYVIDAGAGGGVNRVVLLGISLLLLFSMMSGFGVQLVRKIIHRFVINRTAPVIVSKLASLRLRKFDDSADEMTEKDKREIGQWLERIGMPDLYISEKYEELYLGISFSQISDEDMKYVGKLTHLTILDLQGKNVGDKGLSYLTNMICLRELNLNKTKVTNAGMQYLAGLKNLEVLKVENTEVNEAGLEQLVSVKTIYN